MSDLVFIAFPSEDKAEEVRAEILSLQQEYLIEIGDAVIATKDEKGRVKLNQLLNTTAAGAVCGAFWGALIGFLSWCRSPAPRSAPPLARSAAR